jgi:aldose 1-epimerase
MKCGPEHCAAEFSISAETYHAVISPSFGGVIRELTCDGAPVLRSGPIAGGLVLDAACFPCVPYFGRTPRSFEFGKQRISLAPTLCAADAELPIHGEGWLKPWSVIKRSASEAIIEYAHVAQKDAWPWAFTTRQYFTLSDQGLSVRLSLSNTSGEEALAGLGLHPYFNDAESARLAFTASERWTQPIDGQTASFDQITSGPGAGAPAPLPRFLDETYLDFGGVVDVLTSKQILRLSSDAPFLHIYRPRAGDFFCLEPVSHLPTMVLPGEDRRALRVLGQGEEMSLSMRLSVVH